MNHQANAPDDAEQRRSVRPVVCYGVETLPKPDMALYEKARATLKKIERIIVPAREARCFDVKAGQFFRISSI